MLTHFGGAVPFGGVPIDRPIDASYDGNAGGVAAWSKTDGMMGMLYGRFRTLAALTLVSILLISLVPSAAWAAEQHTLWTKRASGTTKHLTAVCLVDEKNGWAVGSEGTILHTTNAGATWTDQSVDATCNLFGVDFADKNTGWAVGWWPSTPTHVIVEAVILKTTDGGAHWIEQSHPDREHRWLTDVVALSPTNAWAVGGNDSPATGSTIMHTANGVSWAGNPFSPAANLFGIWGWEPPGTGDQIVIVGYPNTAIDNIQIGHAFKSVAPSPYPSARLMGVARGFSPGGTVWVAVGDQAADTVAPGVILRMTETIPENWTPVAAPTTKQLRDVAADRGTQMWAVGLQGAIYYSNSTGATWEAQSPPDMSASLWDVAVTKKDAQPVTAGSGNVVHGDDLLIAVGNDGVILTGKRPLVTMTKPVGPTSVKKGKAFSVYGYMKPRHGGKTPVDFEWYNPKTKKWGLVYRLYGTNISASSGRTKYSVRAKLPIKGKWRVRAVHLEHYEHRTIYSSYRSLTVN